MSVGKESEETRKKKSEAQKALAEKTMTFDPMFFKRKGAIGGSVTGVKKGFATFSPEKKAAMQAKAQETRRRNREAK